MGASYLSAKSHGIFLSCPDPRLNEVTYLPPPPPPPPPHDMSYISCWSCLQPCSSRTVRTVSNPALAPRMSPLSLSLFPLLECPQCFSLWGCMLRNSSDRSVYQCLSVTYSVLTCVNTCQICCACVFVFVCVWVGGGWCCVCEWGGGRGGDRCVVCVLCV